VKQINKKMNKSTKLNKRPCWTMIIVASLHFLFIFMTSMKVLIVSCNNEDSSSDNFGSFWNMDNDVLGGETMRLRRTDLMIPLVVETFQLDLQINFRIYIKYLNGRS